LPLRRESFKLTVSGNNFQNYLVDVQSWHGACVARHARNCRTESLRAWKAEKLVFMSTVLYLPTSTKGGTQTPLQESKAKETGICCSETERIAHDLKNCMSVLLLAITSLKGNVDQALISLPRRRVLEDVVGEMNHLVDEMVR